MVSSKQVITALFAGAVCVGAAYAEDKVAVWKGSTSQWIEPSNWVDGVVPGRYVTKDADGNTVTNGTEGWTARFERSGVNWVCEFPGAAMDSISNVVVSGENSMTRIATGSSHVIRLEEGGGLYVDETCQTVPSVWASIGIAGQKSTTAYYTIRNDSPHGELYLRGGFSKFRMDGVFGYPHMRFEGKSVVRLGGTFPGNSGFRPYLDVAMEDGGMVKITNNVYNFRSLEIPEGLAKQVIEIQSGSTLRVGVQPAQIQLNAKSDLEISGDGTFRINMKSGGYLGISKGVTVDIKTAVEQYNTEEPVFAVKGGGTLRITGRNDIPQDLSLYDGTTFEAAEIGMAGEAGEPGLGSAVRFSSGGILRYTGEGETTDRGLVLLNGSGKVVQAGTGPLVFSGDVSASKSGTTLVLSNDTEFPASLSGSVTAANNPAILKTGSGEWILSGENLSSGGVTLEDGTLTVASADALTKLSVDGDGVLKIAEGVSVASELSCVSGTLDIRLGSGAVFTTSSMSGIAPEWLTVNGSPAKFTSDGTIVSMDGNDVEIAARGGVIPNAPDSVVGIVRDGDSGQVTLAEASTRIAALNQEASVEAVVAMGDGEKLTVETVTVRTNAAALVFGAQSGTGAIDVAGDTLTFDAQDTNSLVSIRSGLGMDVSKTLRKTGAGKVVLPDDFTWAGTLQIDEGTFAYTNTTGTQPPVLLKGTGTFEIAGTAQKTFTESRRDFTGTLVLSGGTNIVEESGAIGADQAYNSKITSAVQVKEGAEMHITDPNGLTGHIIVLGGNGVDGTGAVKIMSDAGDGSGKVYSGCSGIRLTSDAVITGHAGLNYYGIIRGGGYRPQIEMNGHKLTKTGSGRLLLMDADVVDPGIIEIVGPSGIWMQRGCDLGPEGSPALIMRDGAVFNSDFIDPQWRPLDIPSGRLLITTGSASRYNRSVNIWKGPVTVSGPGSRLSFTLSNVHSLTRFTIEGAVSGPGRMDVTYESRGILELMNRDNSGWTGSLYLDGARGAGVYAAYPASIPPPNLVTCEFTRVTAPMPNWTKADILNYANNAELSGNAFISVDSSALDDGSVFALSDADVTGDDFALAHDGRNTLVLNVTNEITKPIGIGSFDGTLKVTSANTLRLSRLVATSDSTNGCGRILLDGARDVRLAGADGSVRAGSSMNNYGKGDTGEIEIRNSLLRTDPELSQTPTFRVGHHGNGLLKIGEGAVITARVDIAVGAGDIMGAIWQTGGEFYNGWANMGAHDVSHSGAAYHGLYGGKALYGGDVRFAVAGTTVIGIYGGVMSVGENALESSCLGAGGGFHLYVKEGLFKSRGGSSRTYFPRMSSGHYSSSFVTLDGEGATVDFCGQTLYMGCGTRTGEKGPAKAVLNINAGVVTAGEIGRYPTKVDDTVQRAYVNFNGGVYRPTALNSFGVSSGYPTVPNRVTVFAGGVTIDTPDGVVSRSYAPFVKPSGNSVVSVPVPAELASRELVSPPYIEIFDVDGEGDGATAYAELDVATRRISRIVVTSPGWDYTTPKAVFKLGGEVQCTNDCAVASAVGGGFTKTGEGKYILAAANSYSGPTVIRAGTLKLENGDALPSDTVVSLQGGALDLNGYAVKVAGITGTGGVITNGTVSLEGLTYDVSAGECVTYGCPVEFSPGAVVTVLNADDLDRDARYAIARFEGGVVNAPLAFAGLPEETAGEWKLILSRGYLKLYRPRGSVVTFR